MCDILSNLTFGLFHSDIPRIPGSPHPPLESSKSSRSTSVLPGPSRVFKEPFPDLFSSGFQFLRVPEDGPALHIGDVPHQSRDPAGPASGAAGTALCKTGTRTWSSRVQSVSLRGQTSSRLVSGEAVVRQGGPSADRQRPAGHGPAPPTGRPASEPLRQDVLPA